MIKRRKDAEKAMQIDRDAIERMIDSMDFRNGEIDMTTLRNSTFKQLAFFNKLCLMSARVKVCAQLFSARKPKFERVYEEWKEQ